MSNMSNGKTYTEVVLEFTNMLVESERRQTQHNIDVMQRLGRGDEKFKAINDKVDTGCVRMDKRIDKNGDRLDDHDDDFKDVQKNQKWLGLGEGGLFILLGWLGLVD